MTAIIAATKHGPMLVPPYDEYVAQALIRLGEYAPTEFETWRPYLPVGGTVIDAGANLGAHTLPFAHAVGPTGHVLAVEPQGQLFRMLCGTLVLNGITHADLRHAALGRSPGAVIVPTLDYSRHANFGGLALDQASDENGTYVPVVTIDDSMSPARRVDFLKIDVEGAEVDVLHGAELMITRDRPVLSVEADRDRQVPALLGWLRSHHYRAWWHRPFLGPLWPNIVSINLLALPRERTALPDPTGDVEVVIP